MLFKRKEYVPYETLMQRVEDIEDWRFIDQTARHNLKVIMGRESK